ncbi:MAG: short-chain dehydrogenase [Porticoccaceae bacterium]|nr:MAG: short-chain dehydrogenase [Porticoccaceae bacterium]
MVELRFDGLTVVVTGAGSNPGIGRACAHLFAARGANLIINDVGGESAWPEVPAPSASAVAEEIRALGGRALADHHSVADEEGARALVERALEAYGRLDVLVNNAAVCLAAPVDEMSAWDIEHHLRVNLLGPFWTSRAAWPHLRRQGGGAIVNLTSGAMAGYRFLAAYGASKGGLWSLTRALAAEGKPFGVRVNAVNPGAYTRLVLAQQRPDSPLLQHARAHLPAELVAPVVAFLAHPSCPLTGECLEAVGGAVRRILLARAGGFQDPGLTPEGVAARLDELLAAGVEEVVPAGELDPAEWHLRPYRASG